MKRTSLYRTILILILLAPFTDYKGSTYKKEISADKILVLKSKRMLLLYSKNTVIKKYAISLGRIPVGAKQFEGDNKTPEGIYFIESKDPHSTWYKTLSISYPGKLQIATAKKANKNPGSAIMIHGLRNDFAWIGSFHLLKDWTAGCIAVTNNEMDEIYNAVAIGTEIEIRP
jgi:murein L,D-transpeptidase YafK